jgi:zinc protease
LLRSLTYPDLLGKAVALAARQLGQPAFPQAIWLRERERLLASLREANTRPATIAGRAFASAVYGTHPYAYDMTEQTLARIDVADMQAMYAAGSSPAAPRWSVVGAVSRAQVQELLGMLFARLGAGAQGCATLPPVAEVAALAQPADLRIPADSAQAHVLMGQPGIKRDDPDFFALTVGNYILGGGGFVSRLTSEVREKRGLSYSVYSYFSPSLHAGAFTVGLQTRPDQAAQALAVSREVIARFVAEGPTQAELDAAKVQPDRRVSAADRQQPQAAGQCGQHRLEQAAPGLPGPLDGAGGERVSVADVRAAFARVLQPQRMVTVHAIPDLFDRTVFGGQPVDHGAHQRALLAWRGAAQDCGEQVLLLFGVVHPHHGVEKLEQVARHRPGLGRRLQQGGQSGQVVQPVGNASVALREVVQGCFGIDRVHGGCLPWWTQYSDGRSRRNGKHGVS